MIWNNCIIDWGISGCKSLLWEISKGGKIAIYMLEKITNSKNIIEHLETIGECYLSIAKELSKINAAQPLSKNITTRGKTDSYATKKTFKKKGVNDKLQKGSVSYRPSENRYMYRYRDKMQNNKVVCGYAKTKKEAQSLLKKELADYYDRLSCFKKTGIKHIIPINNDRASTETFGMSLNDFFTYWVDTFKKQELKESTYMRYKELFKRYAEDNIGKKKVAGISSSDLQTFFNNVPAYSAKKRLMQYFKDVFDLLHKQNYITVNPMVLVVLPKKNKDDTPLSDEEENASQEEILMYKNEKILLNHLTGKSKKNKHYYATKFILYTGLRRGEMLGLQWKHIDFENETIKIMQQFNYDTKKISTVKTEAANRIIPMFPETLEVLKELKHIKQNTSEDDFIFLEDSIHLTQRLAYYTNQLGFQINPHLLRHTFASRCYACGLNPVQIRDLLGHESIDTTLNVYTHTLQADDKEVIQKMRGFFVQKEMILEYS